MKYSTIVLIRSHFQNGTDNLKIEIQQKSEHS